MDGIEIAGRFAFAPNSLSYCGKRTFGEIFAKYLSSKTPANKLAAENAIMSFRAHYSYLQLIAKATGKKPFDAKVTEAFWLGNELLDEVPVAELKKLICTKFVGKGLLSKARAAKIAKSVPDSALAHHSFHPLFIGSITGVVDRTAKTADLCRPAWGKVIEVRGKMAVLDSQELVCGNDCISLVPSRRIVKLECAGLMPVGVPKIGDIIAAHWDFAVMKLSVMQAAELEEATKRNISAANGAGIRLE